MSVSMVKDYVAQRATIELTDAECDAIERKLNEESRWLTEVMNGQMVWDY